LLLVTTSFSFVQGLRNGVQENHAALPTVAMCIAGQMRAGFKPEVIESQVSNMRLFAPNINVFAYINPENEDPSPWETLKQREIDSDPFAFFKERWGENLIKLKQYTKKDVETPANTCEDRFPLNGTRLYSQWMTWKGCYDMVNYEEILRQTKYDVIVKLRPDTQLQGRVPFSAHDVINTQPAVWGRINGHHQSGLSDDFIVTHRDTADVFFGTHRTYWKCWDKAKMDNVMHNYLGEHVRDEQVKEILSLAGEMFLMNHLKDFGVPVHNVWTLKKVVTIARNCKGSVVQLGNGLQACQT